VCVMPGGRQAFRTLLMLILVVLGVCDAGGVRQAFRTIPMFFL